MKRNHSIALVIAAVLIGVYTLITIFVVQYNETEFARYKEFVHRKEVAAANRARYFEESGYSPKAISEVDDRKELIPPEMVFTKLRTKLLWLNILFGLIPAVIAQRKGRSFSLWWFYGATLFIVALPHSLIMKADVRVIAKRKQVAEQNAENETQRHKQNVEDAEQRHKQNVERAEQRRKLKVEDAEQRHKQNAERAEQRRKLKVEDAEQRHKLVRPLHTATTTMKKIGLLTLVIGLLGLIATLVVDTTVETQGGDRVHNIGLMNAQQNLVLVFIAVAVVGVVILISNRKTQSLPSSINQQTIEPFAKSSIDKNQTDRSCPFCAERIKAQAIVCRYCGRDVVPLVL